MAQQLHRFLSLHNFFYVGPNRSSFYLINTTQFYTQYIQQWIPSTHLEAELTRRPIRVSIHFLFLRIPSVHQESELNRSMHWYSIDCLLWGRSELLHQTHMSVVIYCYVWKHQYVFHLVRHPPITRTFFENAFVGIRTRDLPLRWLENWCSRPLGYGSRIPILSL